MARDKIKIIKGDITVLKVEAIVNAANTQLIPGGGVDGAIHRVGGSTIVEQTKEYVQKNGYLKVGAAMVTNAGNLNAKRIIHTVGPRYKNGDNMQDILLADCYESCINIASKEELQSIAFPCISTGVYGYPKNEAAKVALSSIFKLLEEYKNIKMVVIVCFDEENYNLYKRLYKDYSNREIEISNKNSILKDISIVDKSKICIIDKENNYQMSKLSEINCFCDKDINLLKKLIKSRGRQPFNNAFIFTEDKVMESFIKSLNEWDLSCRDYDLIDIMDAVGSNEDSYHLIIEADKNDYTDDRSKYICFCDKGTYDVYWSINNKISSGTDLTKVTFVIIDGYNYEKWFKGINLCKET